MKKQQRVTIMEEIRRDERLPNVCTNIMEKITPNVLRRVTRIERR